ncbi:MarR family winged helix-turn-helix transcriptional regulator [Rhizobium mongolense]|uniref:MarR family winged helix-turn-helix transcriptional regulator n=1 Tax=Rhizobium mongolense TaxID=57676 RepID=UPI001FEFDC95|nr:MarR family transcriptional regulator [Rhizobium mongolense]
MTSRLDRLEKRGLIERQKSDEDSRSFLVKLSKRGRTVAEQAFREDMAAEKRLLECFDDQEKAVLSNLLSRLVTHLDQEDKSK